MKKLKQIEPAEHVKNISEYYFSVKLAEVAQMNAQGKDVINLAVGSPDQPPSKATIDALCESARQPMYTVINLIRNSRVASSICRLVQKILRSGACDGRNIAVDWFKGRHLAYFAHIPKCGRRGTCAQSGYPTYTSVSALMRANIIPYDLLENDHWQPDFEALEEMDLSGVKLMWVNYPNMPTGANASRELFEKLVAFGKKHRIVICHDNPYSFILNDRPMSILSVDGAKDICIELNSMSKAHNMPGWRMGMLASNTQFVKWVLREKSNIDSGQFKPMQMATIAALSNPPEWYARMNKLYAERRVIAEKIMDLLNCKYDKNQTGLFLWAKIDDNETGSEEFIDDILYHANVFITPGFIFGSNGERYIRISLGVSTERMWEAYRRIADYVEKQRTTKK